MNEGMKFTEALHAVLRFMVCFLLGLLVLTQCYCKLSCCCCVICEADSECSCGAAELLHVFLSSPCRALNVLCVVENNL